MSQPFTDKTTFMKRWQQYGIAISAAWVLGTVSYQRYEELPKAKEYATHIYFICTERKMSSGDKDIQPCVDRVGDDWDEWMNRKWARIAWLALVPVAIGWFGAFAGHFLYRKFKPDQATPR